MDTSPATAAAPSSSRECIIGVDIGTTSVKAVAYGRGGEALSRHAAEPGLVRPAPDAAEQDPHAVFEAVCGVIAAAAREARGQGCTIIGVALGSAMHSVILIDESGRPLTGSITWADNRARSTAEEIRSSPIGHRLYRRTGTVVHAMSPLVKIAWLSACEPDLWRRTARVVGIKEFIVHELFGQWVVDEAIASATGLLDLRGLHWDAEGLEVAGVRPEQLSRLVPVTHTFSGLDPAMAARLGLPADVPFIVGASDGALSNLGLGAVGPGEVALNIGTSGALRVLSSRPLVDTRERSFCYALDDSHFLVGGAVNNGGLVLRWLCDTFAPGKPEAEAVDMLMAQAASAPPGAGGLLFHPYLTGERSPLWNGDARASYLGLTLGHGQPHLIRAALEGVVLHLRSLLPALEELAGPPTSIRASGGFARSPLWCQMVADIFDAPILFPANTESCCLGAAMLGFLALKRFSSLEETRRMAGPAQARTPSHEAAEAYRGLLPLFMSLPEQLAPAYGELAEYQRQHFAAGAKPSS